MKPFLKTWAIEWLWIAGWILLSLNYVFEKASIKCEICLDFSYCPPCKTPFMTNFWLILAVFNALIVASMIVRRGLQIRRHGIRSIPL